MNYFLRVAALLPLLSHVGALLACAESLELPQASDWSALGTRLGTDSATAYRSNLALRYASPVSADFVMASPTFTIPSPWLNVRIEGDRLHGNLALVLQEEDGDHHTVTRKSPITDLQGPGWLNDGWFSFDVGDYIGRKGYLQLTDIRDIEEVNIRGAVFTDAPKGNLALDWYVEAVAAVLARDAMEADADPFRPILHTAAPSGKTWDANGLVYRNGLYHFFYLVRPIGTPPLQGHKVSPDLVRWEERPPAVVPSWFAGEEGVWSGSAVIDDDGRCHIFYTGVGPDRSAVFSARQGHAVSLDTQFNRFERRNISIIKFKDVPRPVQHLRDPFVFRHDGRWYMTLTGSIPRHDDALTSDPNQEWPHSLSRGALFLFASEDLYEWNYVNLSAVSEDKRLWEVSDFFFQDGYWFFSPGGNEYHLGRFDFQEGSYTPVRPKGVASAGLFYAYRSMTAPDGRIIALGRIKEGGDLQKNKWEGAYSFPREWWIQEGVLHQRPARELRTLRREHREFSGPVENGTIRIENAATEFELIVEMELGTASQCGLEIRRSPDGSQGMRISWDGESARIGSFPEKTDSGNEKWWEKTVAIRPEKKDDPNRIRFHVFVDRGLLELFIDDQKTFERWTEDLPLDYRGVAAFAEGGTAHVSSLDIWSLSR